MINDLTAACADVYSTIEEGTRAYSQLSEVLTGSLVYDETGLTQIDLGNFQWKHALKVCRLFSAKANGIFQGAIFRI